MDKKAQAKEYLESLLHARKAEDSRQLLFTHLTANACSSDRDQAMIGELQRKRDALHARTDHVARLLGRLPDGRGKTALMLYYVYGKPMTNIMKELHISDRQLRRDIDKALTMLADHLTKEGKEV